MGATLVAKAITKWGPVLSDRAFRVLMGMAVTAKDTATRDVPKHLYFGGQEALALGLPHTRGGTKESAIRTIKRAIAELIAVGAIECTSPAQLGAKAVYKLTLENTPSIQDRDCKESTYFINRGDNPSPPGGDNASPPGGDNRSPYRGTTEVPLSEEPIRNHIEELEEEEAVAVRTELTVGQPDPTNPTQPSTHSDCGNPACVLGYIPNPAKGKRKQPRNIRCPTCHPPPNVIPITRKRAT